MEGRLLHARKLPNRRGVDAWRVTYPDRRGIPIADLNIIPPSPLHTYIDPDAIAFLIDLAGHGGPWDGW